MHPHSDPKRYDLGAGARWPDAAPPFTGPAYAALVGDPEARRLDDEADGARAREAAR